MSRDRTSQGDFAASASKRLTSYPPVSRMTIQGWKALLFGLPFLAAGIYITGIGLGVFEVEPSSVHAPLWVIAVSGGVFLLVGLLLIVHAALGMARLARLRREESAHPNEPWMRDYGWDPHGIFSRKSSSLFPGVFGMGIVVGLLAVLNWVAFYADRSFIFVVVAGLLDLIFGLAFLISGKKALAGIRFGRTYLEFGEFPPRPGQVLEVRANCRHDVGEAQSLSAHLHFVEERYERSGTDENSSEVVGSYELYGDTLELEPHLSRNLGTVGLDLEFLIPDDAPSTILRARPASYWELELRADFPGADLLHRYLIPIYGEQQSPKKRAA